MIELGRVLSENPIRFILYDVKKGYLKKITAEEIDLSENDSFVVNFCADDERVLVQAGIPTISMQNFLSMCSGYVVNDSDMDAVFRYMTGFCYNNIFCSSRVDFSILYESTSYWHGISRIISQGMNMIEQQGLEDALRLEIETSKALHHMMDEAYPLDAKAVMSEYHRLQNILSETQRRSAEENGDLTELSCFCQKITDKMQRIPAVLCDRKGSRAFIRCEFRSIGTDTARITTRNINIQGLPKTIRKCLRPRRDGNKLVEVDLVNSQVAILACMSGEKTLICSYANGIDLYSKIAADLTGRVVTDISLKERRGFKAMILKILYGAGLTVIEKDLMSNGIKMTRAEVKILQQSFYERYPAVRVFADKVKSLDCIQLPTGRKWRMDTVASYKRLAYILQYVESIILREILVMLDKQTKEKRFRLYLCIHDSVILEIEKADSDEIMVIVQDCMNQVICKYFPELLKVHFKEVNIYE